MGRTIAKIVGVAGYVPEYRLTNAELETMVDTNDEWIRTRTGIVERRILKDKTKASSDMGAEAVKQLLKKTGTAPDEVDLLICATATPDMLFPDTANVIRDKVGITSGFGFEISAACSGFLYALTTGARFVEGGLKKVIVVGADKMSSIVDYTDRSTCIIFGDAAAAVMLEPTDDGLGIIDSVLESDGSGRHLLYQKAGGSLHPATHETVENKEHFIYQEGRAVFKYAINGMVGSIKQVLERNGLSKEDIHWLVPHQANKRIIDGVANMFDFPKEKVMVNIQKYGNTTTATIPLCLWEWEDKLHKGDNLILTAFGGGFTWGATFLKWGY